MEEILGAFALEQEINDFIDTGEIDKRDRQRTRGMTSGHASPRDHRVRPLGRDVGAGKRKKSFG